MTRNEDAVFGGELFALMQKAAGTAGGEADAVGPRLLPGGIKIRTRRERVPLSWPGFAHRFGFAVAAAVRNWEQALGWPDFLARMLLMVTAGNPERRAQAAAKVQAV